jgi:hypothetical protein
VFATLGGLCSSAGPVGVIIFRGWSGCSFSGDGGTDSKA